MKKKICNVLIVILFASLVTWNATSNNILPEKENTDIIQTDSSGNNTENSAEEFGSSESADDESAQINAELADIPEEDIADYETEDYSAHIVPPTKVKGIYVTGPIAGTERMSELVSLVEETELNTVVIDIKNDEGILTYDIDIDLVKEMDAYIKYVRDMPGLIEELHSKGIYVIGRIVCFKDPKLANYMPELKLVTPDGRSIVDANGLEWVNPYRNEVWDYICTIAETATDDGFDEIQFDYVRFPIGDDANVAEYGVDIEEYCREDGLNDFFAYTVNRLHQKGIIVGADLFGTVIGSDTDRDRTGQDYVDIVGVADVVCPMVYPSHYNPGTFGLDVPDAYPYETVYNAMSKSVEVIEAAPDTKPCVIRPWLQCFNAIWVSGHITYDAKEIKEQIRAVNDAGYDEWILWNASNHYDQVEEALNN